MKELPKAYEPKNYEAEIYRAWEQSGYFNPDNLKSAGEPFTISLPPPNATGTLHLGHTVMLALQDLMARFWRLKGRKVLWVPGTDHAAIATQNVVEKKIFQEEKKTRFDFGREEFVRRVAEFAESSRGNIRSQIRAVGASCDWSRERYTLDNGLSRAVREVFVRLYNDGLIYRGKRIVNWCYRCGTTLADDEVEYKEQKAKFYYLKYGPITIGTARPETKVLDKVIIVHPDDARYKDYVGKEFDVPWIDGTVKAKVVADKVAEMEVGTGAMTITPAHSFVDFELAQKYGFEVVEIVGPDGKLTRQAGKFAGLNVKQARQAIVEELRAKGLIEKIDEEYVHNLSVCYRCGAPVEPIPSEQWFVAVDKPFRLGWFRRTTLKKLALKAVRSGQIKIVPDRFVKTYFQWMANLHDWCISRQIWFGHRVPVWYCGTPATAPKLRMGFAEVVIPRVLGGMTKTYRIHDHYFKVGDRVAFTNSRRQSIFGYGTITKVERSAIKDIPLADPLHKASYKSLDELLAAFRRHYPPTEIITGETEAVLYTYTFKPADQAGAQLGCGRIIVAVDEPKQCPHCGGIKLTQDPDTLDTWFSSSLWTFSTLGWPERTKDLKTYHPTSVMETGYDILFFWVARMILMTSYVLKQVPFRTVYLHGMVRDKQGRKMSKSLGNGIDPVAMIDKYGADALRLAMIIGTTPGNDFSLYEEKIAGYRNFVNKLWNIVRFALLNVGEPKAVATPPQPRTLADKWIMSRFRAVAELVTHKLAAWQFSEAGEALYDFTWHELADWYLEIAKLEGGKDEILCYLLTQLLKLWHPYTPFVTEVLWGEAFGGQAGLLMVQSWPTSLPEIDKKAEADFAPIREVITVLRNFRTEHKVPPTSIIKVALEKVPTVVSRHQKLIEGLRTKATVVAVGDPAWERIKVSEETVISLG
ncbi:MAG: class I tRNA ligase family protein [Candidatus Kerfeldbacteria bacterium]|nr:class I tRNA ligase family protein [Candidatus Kerfeldbacteria bacterium]